MKDVKAPTGIILSRPVRISVQRSGAGSSSSKRAFLSPFSPLASIKLADYATSALLCAFAFLSMGTAAFLLRQPASQQIEEADRLPSLASLTGRFRSTIGGEYAIDSDYLHDRQPSLLAKVANSIGLAPAVERPHLVQQRPVIASSVVNVSARLNPITSLKPLVADKYESYNLVARKLVQIIKRRGRKDVDAGALAQKIIVESKRANFDPLFVAAVIKSESAFDRFAVSSAGARGLMQIMPSTGTFIAGLEGFESIMKRRLTDPDYNVQLGIAYLKYLEQMYKGDRILVLTAYNWGPGRVQDAIEARRNIPREVMNYALKILKDYQEWVNEIVMAA